MRIFRPPCVAVIAAAAIALASCATKHPVAPVVIVPSGPAATTPTGVVERLAWAVANRDVPAYSALLTDDFAFVFAANDSAGNFFRARGGLSRTQDSTAMHHMLAGGGSQLPLSSLSMGFDRTLMAQPDPRPGMNPRWHQSVRSSVNFTIDLGDQVTTSAIGHALFYVVRGDSAGFPPGRAVSRDSSLWYVSRWEDQTAEGGGPQDSPLPLKQPTIGWFKVMYLDPATGVR